MSDRTSHEIETLTIRIPTRFECRGGRKVIMMPEDAAIPTRKPHRSETLSKPPWERVARKRATPRASRSYTWESRSVLARRYDDAVTAFRKARQFGDVAYRWLAATYGQLGREQDAERRPLTPDFSFARHLEMLHFPAHGGRRRRPHKAGLPE
jgi:hypothetical protein